MAHNTKKTNRSTKARGKTGLLQNQSRKISRSRPIQQKVVAAQIPAHPTTTEEKLKLSQAKRLLSPIEKIVGKSVQNAKEVLQKLEAENKEHQPKTKKSTQAEKPKILKEKADMVKQSKKIKKPTKKLPKNRDNKDKSKKLAQQAIKLLEPLSSLVGKDVKTAKQSLHGQSVDRRPVSTEIEDYDEYNQLKKELVQKKELHDMISEVIERKLEDLIAYFKSGLNSNLTLRQWVASQKQTKSKK